MSKVKVQLDEDVNPLLARDLRNQITYPGILYVPQVSYAQLFHRTLRFLSEASEEAARDVFIWIP